MKRFKMIIQSVKHIDTPRVILFECVLFADTYDKANNFADIIYKNYPKPESIIALDPYTLVDN